MLSPAPALSGFLASFGIALPEISWPGQSPKFLVDGNRQQGLPFFASVHGRSDTSGVLVVSVRAIKVIDVPSIDLIERLAGTIGPMQAAPTRAGLLPRTVGQILVDRKKNQPKRGTAGQFMVHGGVLRGPGKPFGVHPSGTLIK